MSYKVVATLLVSGRMKFIAVKPLSDTLSCSVSYNLEFVAMNYKHLASTHYGNAPHSKIYECHYYNITDV